MLKVIFAGFGTNVHVTSKYSNLATQIENAEIGSQFWKYSFAFLFTSFLNEGEALNCILKFCAWIC